LWLIRWRSLRFAESIIGAMVLGLPPVGYANDCLRHATRTMLMIIDSLYREASPTITAGLIKPAKLTGETFLSIYSPVAKLPDAVIAMEFRLCQQIGETAETLPELEELQNIRDRLVSSYSRLQNILLRVAQSQPIAAQDMLGLLYRSMDRSQSFIDASIASLQDIQRNWN
jgi:hypothetical protein